MRILQGALAAALSLAVMTAVTVLVWYVKLESLGGAHHPVFFYLVPIVLVAFAFGGRLAILCAAAAVAYAAYYFYDPPGFYVANQLEVGELICFAILASIAVKCTVELTRPVKLPSVKSRYGRP